MDIVIAPSVLCGDVTIPASKSQLHRLLILASFADRPTRIRCNGTNRDVEATAACLQALGAKILHDAGGYTVYPAENIPQAVTLFCGESGSTLRFLLPIVAALGVDATFCMEGRLSQRPIAPLCEALSAGGCTFTVPKKGQLRCQGKLQAGEFVIDGTQSSQFVSGMLMALALMEQGSRLLVAGQESSAPYIRLTKQALSLFGADPECPGANALRSPGVVDAEGDWSSGAFFLTANALGSRINVLGIDPDSTQGDREIVAMLKTLDHGFATLDMANTPDLAPILAVAAAQKKGAEFTGIQTLRLKESDRVAAICAMICDLGGKAVATENTLTISANPLIGGTLDARGDHRIAMAGAIAATVCKKAVRILGAECVEKSYPDFWQQYGLLGGMYES